MSLLSDFGKICVFKEKTRTPDGEGGYYIDWTDGASGGAVTWQTAFRSRLNAWRKI